MPNVSIYYDECKNELIPVWMLVITQMDEIDVKWTNYLYFNILEYNKLHIRELIPNVMRIPIIQSELISHIIDKCKLGLHIPSVWKRLSQVWSEENKILRFSNGNEFLISIDDIVQMLDLDIHNYFK